MEPLVRRQLSDLRLKLAHRLWSLQEGSLAGLADALPSHLIAPGDSNEARISEQEARIVLSQILDSSYPWYYSVETPTVSTYKFSGKKKLRARSDMTLYSQPGARLIDIEFKEGNPHPSSIEKDICKLLREGRDGMWFHILRNTDHHTFSFLFEKIKKSLVKNANYANNRATDSYGDRALTFAICVLAPENPSLRVMYEGSIELGNQQTSFADQVARLFAEKEQMPSEEDGWTRVFPSTA